MTCLRQIKGAKRTPNNPKDQSENPEIELGQSLIQKLQAHAET
jgi:hypothetical protein